MTINNVKIEISKNKNAGFFLMSQGSFNPKIRFLGQKVCPVARVRTDGQTDGQTDTKVTTEGTLSGFQEFFLQPIIKDRPGLAVEVNGRVQLRLRHFFSWILGFIIYFSGFIEK